jgi:hypothetical protein
VEHRLRTQMLLSIVAIGLLCLVACADSTSAGSSANAVPSPKCSEEQPPCPPSLPESKASSSFAFEDQLSFTPPAEDATPGLTAADAEDASWRAGGGGGSKSQEPVLALLPAGGNIEKDLLVWVVQYREIPCIPAAGGLDPSSREDQPMNCNHAWTNVIDAETGDFIYGYTDA